MLVGIVGHERLILTGENMSVQLWVFSGMIKQIVERKKKSEMRR